MQRFIISDEFFFVRFFGISEWDRVSTRTKTSTFTLRPPSLCTQPESGSKVQSTLIHSRQLLTHRWPLNYNAGNSVIGQKAGLKVMVDTLIRLLITTLIRYAVILKHYGWITLARQEFNKAITLFLLNCFFQKACRGLSSRVDRIISDTLWLQSLCLPVTLVKSCILSFMKLIWTLMSLRDFILAQFQKRGLTAQSVVDVAAVMGMWKCC